MADTSGIGAPRPGGIAPAGNRTDQSGRRSSQGEVLDERSRQHGPERQWIRIDGRQFDRSAPRGTYLNILV